MKSREDVESYLMRIGVPYERLEPEMWNVKPEGNENPWHLDCRARGGLPPQGHGAAAGRPRGALPRRYCG